MNEEIRKVLLEVATVLQEKEERDVQRIQELNSTVYWLTLAATEGLGQAVSKFSKEVMEAVK
ncbi:hypothetical protein KAR10_09345 [bacterium]|nr:hypothetical protein [bacterium]